MNEMERLVKKGDMVIVTSAITIAEVLSTNMPADKRIDFPRLFGRREHVLIDVDRRVAVHAAQYRDHYVTCGDQYAPKTLDGADSIHLATAVREKCDAFYTFDGIDGKHVERRVRKLLQLNNQVASDSLTIVAPSLNTIAQPVRSGLFKNP